MADRSWKILLVEDDEDDYILTRDLLYETQTQRCSLEWVRAYQPALEKLTSNAYDVALVDYFLGEKNGLELIREAVGAGCDLPLILLTGRGNYQVDIQAMQAGASDYLAKGEVNAPLLERTIRYALERHQAREALQRAHEELENRVEERTRELAQANQDLRAEITERRRVETALRESEVRFRRLAETTSSAIFIVQKNCIVYANPAAQMITGYSPEELHGWEFRHVAHPAYRGMLQEHGLLSQWDERFPPRYELKLLTKSGEERWVDITAGLIEHDGQPALVITAFDITERDLAEKALRKAKKELEIRVAERTFELKEANERLEFELAERLRVAQELESSLAENRAQREFLETLMAVAPVGIAVVRGPEHRYEFANPYYQSAPGIPDVVLQGRTAAEVFPFPDAPEVLLPLLDQVYETGEPASLREFRADAGTGQEQSFWNIDYLPLWSALGNINGILIIIIEVTDQILAREER